MNFLPTSPLRQVFSFKFEMMKGGLMDARIEEVGADNIQLNFNHPLAGEDLHFEIVIADLREATHARRTGARTRARRITSTTMTKTSILKTWKMKISMTKMMRITTRKRNLKKKVLPCSMTMRIRCQTKNKIHSHLQK
jgi:hypothetical protein